MSNTPTSQNSWSSESTFFSEENEDSNTLLSIRERWMLLGRDLFEIIEEQQIVIQSLQDRMREMEEKMDELRQFIREHTSFGSGSCLLS